VNYTDRSLPMKLVPTLADRGCRMDITVNISEEPPTSIFRVEEYAKAWGKVAKI
jgi:hypothetical protein